MGGDDKNKKIKTQGPCMRPNELLAGVMKIASASLGVARKLRGVPPLGFHLSTQASESWENSRNTQFIYPLSGANAS